MADYDVEIAETFNTAYGEVVLEIEETTTNVLEVTTQLQVIEIVAEGPQGPAGPTGATGPRGLPGAGAVGSFVHEQTTPAATWTIVHNMATKPSVVLELDSAPAELVYTDVTYPDLDTIVVEWPSAETGKAYI